MSIRAKLSTHTLNVLTYLPSSCENESRQASVTCLRAQITNDAYLITLANEMCVSFRLNIKPCLCLAVSVNITLKFHLWLHEGSSTVMFTNRPCVKNWMSTTMEFFSATLICIVCRILLSVKKNRLISIVSELVSNPWDQWSTCQIFSSITWVYHIRSVTGTMCGMKAKTHDLESWGLCVSRLKLWFFTPYRQKNISCCNAICLLSSTFGVAYILRLQSLPWPTFVFTKCLANTYLYFRVDWIEISLSGEIVLLVLFTSVGGSDFQHSIKNKCM